MSSLQTVVIPISDEKYKDKLQQVRKRPRNEIETIVYYPTTCVTDVYANRPLKPGKTKKYHKQTKVHRNDIDGKINHRTLPKRLDDSCNNTLPPDIPNSKFVRFKTEKVHDGKTKPKQYQVAVFKCRDGYRFSKSHSGKMFCSREKWMGKKPVCEKIRHIDIMQGDDPDILLPAASLATQCTQEQKLRCPYLCSIIDGVPVCECPPGFEMEGSNCVDINECEDPDIKSTCKFGCVNFIGSYYCADHSNDTLADQPVTDNETSPKEEEDYEEKDEYDEDYDDEGDYEEEYDEKEAVEEEEKKNDRRNDNNKDRNNLEKHVVNENENVNNSVTTIKNDVAVKSENDVIKKEKGADKHEDDYDKEDDDYEENKEGITERVSKGDKIEFQSSNNKVFDKKEFDSSNSEVSVTEETINEPLTESFSSATMEIPKNNIKNKDSDVVEETKDESMLDSSTSSPTTTEAYNTKEFEEDTTEATTDVEYTTIQEIIQKEIQNRKDEDYDYVLNNNNSTNNNLRPTNTSLIDNQLPDLLKMNATKGTDVDYDGDEYDDEYYDEDLDKKSSTTANPVIAKTGASETEEEHIKKILDKLPEVDIEKVNTDIHQIIGNTTDSIDDDYEETRKAVLTQNSSNSFESNEVTESVSEKDEEYENYEEGDDKGLEKEERVPVEKEVAKCEDGYAVGLEGECADIDECQMNPKVCSHGCQNSIGSYVCDCPIGFALSSSSPNICQDIDECLDNPCSHTCTKVNGILQCTCPAGHLLGDDQRSCEDVDECQLDSGDQRSCKLDAAPQCRIPAPPENGILKCLGTKSDYGSLVPSGTRCTMLCNEGYKLEGQLMMVCSSNGIWDGDVSRCLAATCPSLPTIQNGWYLPGICNAGKTYRGERCEVYCRKGFKRRPDFDRYTCGDNLEWNPTIIPEHLADACIRDIPNAFIRCPANGFLDFNLPPGQSNMIVRIPKPETNVDFRYVTSYPSWGMQLETTLPVGRHHVRFTVSSTNYFNDTTFCDLVVNVLDREEPRVTGCPENIEITLPRGENTHIVYWREPLIDDNVGVTNVYKSREPGSQFGPGLHRITYVANDEAGNRAFCYFNVNVKVFDSEASNSIRQRATYANHNTAGMYRALLICPSGVQYMSDVPDNYNNMITREAGCRWEHVRVRRPMEPQSFKIPVYKSSRLPSNVRSKRRQFFKWSR
ncbi:hypothetical protein NQ317_014922 [Molorchus minor]|uniref:Uncharacterized protein n=1 Tax=Molorchus minor TaxID=1323400 RepID=A0ABQ9JZC8_9CUCU|nr:hypothetical protein NQ317_014922 [Molorchus minor]